MNAKFTPPESTATTLYGIIDELLVDLLSATLVDDGVDLDDESACRAAIIAAGQSARFTDEHLSTIRLAAMISRGKARPTPHNRSV